MRISIDIPDDQFPQVVEAFTIVYPMTQSMDGSFPMSSEGWFLSKVEEYITTVSKDYVMQKRVEIERAKVEADPETQVDVAATIE